MCMCECECVSWDCVSVCVLVWFEIYWSLFVTNFLCVYIHTYIYVCDIIIERKSYTFKNPETRFKINKDLSCNSKNVVYIIECSKCKEIYIWSTQALNTRISLHKSNIKITENRKLNVSKHPYECRQGYKIMPTYQSNDYTPPQIKEKKL